MQATRSNPMVLAQNEQSQHLRRKRPMDAQVWPHNAVPVFHRTAGTNHHVPCLEDLGNQLPPGRMKALQQFLPILLTQDRSALPRHQREGLCSQLSRDLLLDDIQGTRKQQPMRQRQQNLFADALDLALQGGGSLLSRLSQQEQHAVSDAFLWPTSRDHRLQETRSPPPRVHELFGHVLRARPAALPSPRAPATPEWSAPRAPEPGRPDGKDAQTSR